MDRNAGSELPLEATFEVSVIAHETKLFQTPSFSQSRQVTTHELREILNRHPAWEKTLEITSVDGNKISLQEIRNAFSRGVCTEIPFRIYDFDTYKALFLTAVCRDYSVRIDTSEKTHFLTLTSASPDDTAIDFPAAMFFPPIKENLPLRRWSGRGFYNQEHRFSQWLIHNQAALRETVTGLYNDILNIMLETDYKDEFIRDINAILRQLRGYRNNYFGITDELFLTDADFS